MATVVAPGTDWVQASVAKYYGAAVDVCPPRRPLALAGAHRTIRAIRQPEHAQALQSLVLAAFGTAGQSQPAAQPPSRSHSGPRRPCRRRGPTAADLAARFGRR